MDDASSTADTLRWQSRVVLLAILPACAVWTLLEALSLWPTQAAQVCWAVGISITFGLLVRLAHAATPGGALTGGVLTCGLYLFTPGPRTTLWPLFAMLLLTLGASRVGRAKKVALGTSEGARGRSAAQVAANIGVAASAPLLRNRYGVTIAEIALLAALAEATADTLASELGEVFGGTPRLVTTWKAVPPGTDGAVSVAGTLAGVAGAVVVVALGSRVLGLGLRDGEIAAAAALFGFTLDSVLGATVERRGWLTNDAVNFASTLSSAVLAVALAVR